MSVSVDWVDKIIQVPKAYLTLVSGTTYTMDIDEFRLDLRALEDDEEGIVFLPTHTHNTEYIISGVTYARVIQLINGYTVTFEDGNYAVNIAGANSNILDNVNRNQVGVGSQNSAGLISGADVIADAIWDEDLSEHGAANSASVALRGTGYAVGNLTYDSVNGFAGTGYPIGTSYKPSNNLTDTLLIMGYGNVDDLVLRTDLTIGATHDVSNLLIRTIGLMGTDVGLSTGCTANQTTFRNVNLSGVITAGNELLVYDSSIGNLENFRGIMNNVSFAQGSELTLNGWAEIIQGTCGGDPTNEVEISINATPLNISQWTGNLKLTNKSGTDRTVINCNSGNIIIASTCTTGTIQILGTAAVEDNSGVGCTVDVDSLIAVETITDGVWDEALTGLTHNVSQSSGRRLRELGDAIDGSVNDAGASTTVFITNLTEIRDDFYNDQYVRFMSGNLEGHVRVIRDYDGGTKTITVEEAMVEAPDDGIDFIIVPVHIHPIDQVADKIWDEQLSEHITSGSVGELLYVINAAHINKFIWDNDNNRFELYDASDSLIGYMNITTDSGVLQRSGRFELL